MHKKSKLVQLLFHRHQIATATTMRTVTSAQMIFRFPKMRQRKIAKVTVKKKYIAGKQTFRQVLTSCRWAPGEGVSLSIDRLLESYRLRSDADEAKMYHHYPHYHGGG